MRMWMVDPKLMCNKHLVGEHGELHSNLWRFAKRHSMTGYVVNNCLEPEAIASRHDELAVEMLRRGMNHKSPLEQPDISYLPAWVQGACVERVSSRTELQRRCPKCAEMGGGNNQGETL